MEKFAFVTGGVGQIGKAICQQLACQGYQVIFTYRDSESSNQRAEELLTSLPGRGHQGMQVDITDVAGYERAVDDLVKSIGHLDLLVNCAGTTQFVAPENLDGLDEGLIDRIFQVNVRAAITSVRLLVPLLNRAPGGGCIVNISSIAARTANGSNIAYCASKAAMDNLTLSLARALGPSIRVFSVSPGLADTDFVKGVDTSWRDEQCEKTPLKRLVTPEEVANAVVLTTEGLTFSTGAIIPVDGGRPLN